MRQKVLGEFCLTYLSISITLWPKQYYLCSIFAQILWRAPLLVKGEISVRSFLWYLSIRRKANFISNYAPGVYGEQNFNGLIRRDKSFFSNIKCTIVLCEASADSHAPSGVRTLWLVAVKHFYCVPSERNSSEPQGIVYDCRKMSRWKGVFALHPRSHFA